MFSRAVFDNLQLSVHLCSVLRRFILFSLLTARLLALSGGPENCDLVDANRIDTIYRIFNALNGHLLPNEMRFSIFTVQYEYESSELHYCTLQYSKLHVRVGAAVAKGTGDMARVALSVRIGSKLHLVILIQYLFFRSKCDYQIKAEKRRGEQLSSSKKVSIGFRTIRTKILGIILDWTGLAADK